MSTSKTRTQPHYNWLYWQHYRWHEHTAADCERAVLVRGLCWQRHFTAQRQVEADETGCCSARGARAQPRRSNSRRRHSNSRRRAHLGPVRGSAREREGVRGSAGVPAPPGEPGVGERREAAGAGPGSSWGRGAQLQPARRGRRACGGGHARTGVLRGGARSEYCATAWRTGAAAARGGGAAWELLVPELTPPR